MAECVIFMTGMSIHTKETILGWKCIITHVTANCATVINNGG